LRANAESGTCLFFKVLNLGSENSFSGTSEERLHDEIKTMAQATLYGAYCGISIGFQSESSIFGLTINSAQTSMKILAKINSRASRKKAYRKPELLKKGNVKNLTRGDTGSGSDGSGRMDPS
jgi:hypothetical protein